VCHRVQLEVYLKACSGVSLRSFSELTWERILKQAGVVLATVPDRHFGSRSGSKPNHCQIGGPGRQ